MQPTPSTPPTKQLRHRLTPRNATVLTATVSIKTLTIDRRQVTLSTFRQVPDLDVLVADATISPGAILWGWVNYCPGKDCFGETKISTGYWTTRHKTTVSHFHVLWQQGQELLRSPVFFSLDDRWAVTAGYTRDSRDNWPEDKVNNFATSLSKLQKLDQLYIAT